METLGYDWFWKTSAKGATATRHPRINYILAHPSAVIHPFRKNAVPDLEAAGKRHFFGSAHSDAGKKRRDIHR